MTDTTTYTATLSISSTGESNKVEINVSTEPSAVPLLREGKQLPAAYQAMRDVQKFIHAASSRGSFNMDDDEFFNLPAHEQMDVIKRVAAEAEDTVVVSRVVTNEQ